MDHLSAVNSRYNEKIVKPHRDKKLMLILTRRVDERIFIGEDITLCILDIEGNRVRLGLEAPKDVAILREEIHHRYAGDASNDAQHTKSQTDKKTA